MSLDDIGNDVINTSLINDNNYENKITINNYNASEFFTVYHGSPNIIKLPKYGEGNPFNDYGLGFYTTRNKELAGEWAVLNSGKNGYINEYTLNYEGLSVLKLDDKPFEVWVSILMSCRRGEYADEYQARLNKYIKMFGSDFSQYDVIEGWRADDSFFSYIRDFASVTLSLEKLKEAMKLGDLGMQVCLKSNKAFQQITWNKSMLAKSSQFYQSAIMRDDDARKQYRQMKEKTKGTLIFDLIGRDY